MRPYFILSLVIILFSSSSFAAPTYGPNLPPRKKVDLGYQFNYIFDKDLRLDNKDVRSMQNYLNVSLAITDWFCLDGKMGVANVSYEAHEIGYINFNTNFAGGYGFRMKLFELENGLKCVGAFHHISMHPDTRHVDGTKYRAVYNDWEGSAIFSKEFDRFNPYIGIKAGYAYIHRSIEKNLKKVKSDDYVGMVIGTDFRLNETKRLNVEARLFDEYAVSTGFMGRF